MIDSITGFHIEPTNICTLKCGGCGRTQLIEQWPQHWRNHSLDIDILLNFLDVDLAGKDIALCGNYGDPIYHPEFIEFVRRLKQRQAHLTIVTNGSYKTREWWQELTALLDSKDTVRFSVDGLPDTFTQYRINADWESILTGMQVVAQARCHSEWKCIAFAFNQADLDCIKKLSEDIGIKKFRMELSERFDERLQYLAPDTSLIHKRYFPQVEWKTNKSDRRVEPRCGGGKEHFISADGHYSSCCYLVDYRFYYKTPFGKNKPEYNINTHTLSEILQQPQTVEFYQNMEQNPLCQFTCPPLNG
jgi:pyruvate-formate lyase-activating enzyme